MYWKPTVHPAIKKVSSYLSLISFPLTGLIALLVINWIKRGFVEPVNWWVPVFTDPVGYLLSVPLAFLIWLYAAEADRPFRRRFSLSAALLSLWGFTAAAGFTAVTRVKMPAYYVMGLAILGIIAGLFVTVSVRKCCSYALANRKRSLVALFAAGISPLYKSVDTYLWSRICHASAVTVYEILKGCGFIIGFHDGRDKLGNENILLVSTHFGIDVYKPCSGLEGIFIFLFLLSALIIIDWHLFEKVPLTPVYLIGGVYMFIVNALRIATLFAIGYFAWQPDASPFMRSLRQTTFDIFHSMMGMVYYFIAFGVFATCLYNIAATLRSVKVSAKA